MGNGPNLRIKVEPNVWAVCPPAVSNLAQPQRDQYRKVGFPPAIGWSLLAFTRWPRWILRWRERTVAKLKSIRT